MSTTYETDIDFDPTIDPHALDQEWLAQPRLYFHWAKRLAAAKARVDACKAELEVVRAECSRSIRSDPASYGLDKVTESTVPAAVLEQNEYRHALQQLNDAKYEADVVGAAVTALEHRKRALENLVELHGCNYFSTPKAGPRNAEAMAEVEKRNTRRGYSRRADDE